eukprot:879341-Amphidinium_carterae.1
MEICTAHRRENRLGPASHLKLTQTRFIQQTPNAKSTKSKRQLTPPGKIFRESPKAHNYDEQDLAEAQLTPMDKVKRAMQEHKGKKY